ncbi:oligosaccharide flippase family protein [Sediminicoccus sp. KRV36]|uniref:lipopolysaccharide biosynthesis protein n=1 Tax=Sediminicoccus sp. KRV36 TaxID=3133721 RepID=UPI00200E23B7|nr:oligosaccharide flippase family protein [Sediminicoccus rosea]UPY35789.1 polysaccharide biosynthesis C-terminal domain-containing protein [Sediminicoccus rosea]
MKGPGQHPTIISSLIRLGLGLGTRGLEILGKLGLYVLVAQSLGLAEAGLYFIALAWSGVGGTLGRFGLERAAMARIPAELAVNDGAAALRVVRRVLGGTLLGGCLVGGVTSLAGPGLAHALLGQPALAPVLLLTGGLVLADALAISAGCILASLHRNVAAQLTGTSLWPILTLTALWLWPAPDLRDVLMLTILARFATVGMGLAIIWAGRMRFAVVCPGAATAARPLLRLALPLLGVELVQVSLVTMPTLILAAFATPEAVAYFSMASRLSVLTWVILLSVATIASPRMAEQFRLRDWRRLRQTQRAARWASASLAVPPLLGMILLAPWLLGLLGAGFEPGAAALRILCLGQIVNAMFACRDTLLATTGHGDDLLRLNLIQLALATLLAATAVPLLGAEGAALMTAISIGSGALMQSWLARRRVPGAF